MTINLTRIATAVSLIAGLSFSLAFGAPSTEAPAAQNTPATTSTATPAATQTGSTSINTAAPTSNATIPAATQIGTASTTSTTPPNSTGTSTGTQATSPSTNPTKIYVSPSSSTNSASTTNSVNGAPVVNGAQTNGTPMGGTQTNSTTATTTDNSGTNTQSAASTAMPPANGTATTAGTVTTSPVQQQTAVIPQANLIDFSQKAAVVTFTYNYQNYKQNLQAMQSYFTKVGWDSFNKALTASNNLDVVQKEKLSVSATLNGQAEVTQHQQTAIGQTWQVNVPIIVTYQNDKKQTVQQDLTVKLSIATVNTNENANGIGITQFIAMPNVAPATTPAS